MGYLALLVSQSVWPEGLQMAESLPPWPAGSLAVGGRCELEALGRNYLTPLLRVSVRPREDTAFPEAALLWTAGL